MKPAKYLSLFVVMAVTWVLSFNADAGVKAPIKIGLLVGMTGFMPHDGPECLKGAELKLEEIGYKINGQEITLIKEDGASNVVTYVDKARKLVERDKVDVVLGPLFSPGGLAVADYLTRSIKIRKGGSYDTGRICQV